MGDYLACCVVLHCSLPFSVMAGMQLVIFSTSLGEQACQELQIVPKCPKSLLRIYCTII